MIGDGLVDWRLRLDLRLVGGLVLACFDLLGAETGLDSIAAGRFLLLVGQLWLGRLGLGLFIGARLVFAYWMSTGLLACWRLIGETCLESWLSFSSETWI